MPSAYSTLASGAHHLAAPVLAMQIAISLCVPSANMTETLIFTSECAHDFIFQTHSKCFLRSTFHATSIVHSGVQNLYSKAVARHVLICLHDTGHQTETFALTTTVPCQ